MRATGLVVVEAQGFLVNSTTRPCDHVALTFSTTVEVCGSIHLETDCWTVWLSHTLLTFHLWKWFPAERHFLSMEPISVSSCSVCTGTDLLLKLNLWEILCVLKTHISSLNWWYQNHLPKLGISVKDFLKKSRYLLFLFISSTTF